MKKIHYYSKISICFLSLISANYSLAGWNFVPRIELRETYVDNVDLDNRDEEEEFVTEINPGFSLTKEDGRFIANIDYQLSNLFYLEESDRNESLHQLDAVTTTEILKQLFFLDFEAQAFQSLIDPTNRASTRLINTTGNRTDVERASISPHLNYAIGSFAIFNARYRYTVEEFDDEGSRNGNINALSDNDRNRYEFDLINYSLDDRFTWGLHYEYEELDFDDQPKFDFEKYYADIGYRLTNSIRLIGNYGYEDNDFTRDIRTDDPDDEIWEAGFQWSITQRNLIEARVGERFFGDTFNGSWTYAGKRLGLNVQYVEDITAGIAEDFGSITNFGQVQVDVPTRSNEVRERDRLDVSITYQLPKSDFELRGFREDRKFLESLENEDRQGMRFTWLWRFKPRTFYNLDLLWDNDKFDRNNQELDEDSYEFSTGIGHEITPNATVDLLYTYITQDSDDNENEYDAHSVSIGLIHEF